MSLDQPLPDFRKCATPDERVTESAGLCWLMTVKRRAAKAPAVRKTTVLSDHRLFHLKPVFILCGPAMMHGHTGRCTRALQPQIARANLPLPSHAPGSRNSGASRR